MSRWNISTHDWCKSDSLFRCEDPVPFYHIDEEEQLLVQTCLPLTALCDGVPNCPDGQDEAVQRCGKSHVYSNFKNSNILLRKFYLCVVICECMYIFGGRGLEGLLGTLMSI